MGLRIFLLKELRLSFRVKLRVKRISEKKKRRIRLKMGIIMF